MSVVGTPITPPPSTGITCADQSTLAPVTTTAFGSPLYAKLRAVSMRQIQLGYINLSLVDLNGNAVDLSNCPFRAPAVQIRECVLGNLSAAATNVTITNPSVGLIQATVPPTISQVPGIYWCEAGIFLTQQASIVTSQVAATPKNYIYISANNSTYNLTTPQTYTLTVTTAGAPGTALFSITTADNTDNVTGAAIAAFGSATTVGTKGTTITFALDSTRTVDSGQPTSTFILGQQWTVQIQPQLAFSNLLYLYVEPGMFSNRNYSGMFPLPPIQLARAQVLDTDPSENRLLQTYEYDLADICSALERTVHYWNTAQPPVDLYYDSTNYPYYMPNGYISILLEKAAHRFRRNHLAYQGGGLTIDDQNKFNSYMQTSNDLWKDYSAFVMRKKVQLNAEAGYGMMGSPYSFFGSY